MKFISKIFRLPIFVHLLAITALALVAVYGVLKYIDFYTNHNQAVYVPDVRDLQIEEAAPFFEQNQLRFTIVDSVYSRERMPGAIVELMPEANAKVKKNRIIYITINAKTEKTELIPDLIDISYREAFSKLKSIGFRDVQTKYVPGDFLNLTVGVEYDGKLVDSGTRVPLTATLFLVISDGHISPEDRENAVDSIMDEKESGESWF